VRHHAGEAKILLSEKEAWFCTEERKLHFCRQQQTSANIFRFCHDYVMDSAEQPSVTNGHLSAEEVDVELLPLIYELMRG